MRFLILKNYFVEFKIYRNITFRMGATKSYEFSVKENKLAKVAKALGHPTSQFSLPYDYFYVYKV